MHIRRSAAPVGAVALLALLAGCAEGAPAPAASTVTVTAPAPPAETVTVAVTETITEEAPPPDAGSGEVEEGAEEAQDSEFPFPVYELGDTFEFYGAEFTFTDVTVTQQVETVDGAPIVADEGEQLVYVEGEFINRSGEPANLSCSGINNIMLTLYDVDGGEMPPLFDSYRLPGNPECSDRLLEGQGSTYNQVFRSLEGAEPFGFEILETQSFEDAVFVNFTDIPLD